MFAPRYFAPNYFAPEYFSPGFIIDESGNIKYTRVIGVLANNKGVSLSSNNKVQLARSTKRTVSLSNKNRKYL